MSDPIELIKESLGRQRAGEAVDPLCRPQGVILNTADVLALVQEVEDRRKDSPADPFRSAARAALAVHRSMGDAEMMAKLKLLRACLDADGASFAKVDATGAGYVVAAKWREQYTAVLKAGCDMLGIEHSIRPAPGGLPASHGELAVRVQEVSKLVQDLGYKLMRAGYGKPSDSLFARLLCLEASASAKSAPL